MILSLTIVLQLKIDPNKAMAREKLTKSVVRGATFIRHLRVVMPCFTTQLSMSRVLKSRTFWSDMRKNMPSYKNRKKYYLLF